MDDPYAHCPALRGKITDPETSFWRGFDMAQIDARMRAMGHPETWRYGDAERDAMRDAFLAPLKGVDLWVFAYGSLMWDPGFRFAEVRHGQAPGYARHFCLKDTFGARGTPERPGLMAALDRGAVCGGLVFRIAPEAAVAEFDVLWRREMIADGYLPVVIGVDTAQGPVRAVSFLADPASALMVRDLTRAEQVRFLATGRGFLGSSRDYIEGIAAQFEVLGIEDAEVTDLLAEVRAYQDI